MKAFVRSLCCLFILTLFFTPHVFSQDGNKSSFLFDGFEDGNFWKTAADSSLNWTAANMALECRVNSEWSTQGKKSITLSFGPMTKTLQSTFVCTEPFEPDWGKYTQILIDFYNPTEEKISVNIAWMDRENWEWTVCKSAQLEPGENRDVAFSLLEDLRNGKNAGKGPLEAGNEIYCVLIQIVGKNKGGSLLLDNFRLVR